MGLLKNGIKFLNIEQKLNEKYFKIVTFFGVLREFFYLLRKKCEKSYNFKIFFILSVFARYSKTLYHFLIETKGNKKKFFLKFFSAYKGVKMAQKSKIRVFPM